MNSMTVSVTSWDIQPFDLTFMSKRTHFVNFAVQYLLLSGVCGHFYN